MWLLIQRDLRDILGDLKYLVLSLGVPLLITPLLIGLIVGLTKAQSSKEQARVYQVAVHSSSTLPTLSEILEEKPEFALVDIDNAEDALADVVSDKIDALIKVSDQDGQLNITVAHNETGQFSDLMNRLRAVNEQVATKLRQNRFDVLGIDASQRQMLIEPVAMQEEMLKEEKELVGQALGMAVNFIVILWVFTVMMTLAADLVTGDKEHKTIETLLISPISRWKLGLSKWLGLSVVGSLSGMFTLLVYYVTVLLVRELAGIEQLEFLTRNIGWQDILYLYLSLVPLCFILGGCLVLAAINASTLKESQSAASMLMILMLTPLMLLNSGVLSWDGVAQWVPVVNLVLANVEILKGTLSADALPSLLIPNLVVLAIIYQLIGYLYNSEKTLFAGQK